MVRSRQTSEVLSSIKRLTELPSNVDIRAVSNKTGKRADTTEGAMKAGSLKMDAGARSLGTDARGETLESDAVAGCH